MAEQSDNGCAEERLRREAAQILIEKLRIIPHHAISLKRNKYRVIRKVARCAAATAAATPTDNTSTSMP